MEPHLKPPRPPRSPCRTSEPCLKPPRAALAEPGGTLVEPSWNLTSIHPGHPAALAEPGENPRGTLPQTNPDHPAASQNLPQTTPDHPAALAEPGGTLVEPSWNLTSNHPRPSRSPCRTSDPCLKPPLTTPQPGGTLVEPSWNLTSIHPGPPRSPRRTWWNLGGTLVEPCLKPPRTTPLPW